jgi:hypothetical protein
MIVPEALTCTRSPRRSACQVARFINRTPFNLHALDVARANKHYIADLIRRARLCAAGALRAGLGVGLRDKLRSQLDGEAPVDEAEHGAAHGLTIA